MVVFKRRVLSDNRHLARLARESPRRVSRAGDQSDSPQGKEFLRSRWQLSSQQRSACRQIDDGMHVGLFGGLRLSPSTGVAGCSSRSCQIRDKTLGGRFVRSKVEWVCSVVRGLVNRKMWFVHLRIARASTTPGPHFGMCGTAPEQRGSTLPSSFDRASLSVRPRLSRSNPDRSGRSRSTPPAA